MQSSPLKLLIFRFLIPAQAKRNLSRRSGISGIRSAMQTSLGVISGRSKRRLNRYSNSAR